MEEGNRERRRQRERERREKAVRGGEWALWQGLIALSRKHRCGKQSEGPGQILWAVGEEEEEEDEERGGGHDRISCKWQKQEEDISLPRFSHCGHVWAHQTIMPRLYTHALHRITGRMTRCFSLTRWSLERPDSQATKVIKCVWNDLGQSVNYVIIKK